MRGPIFPHFGPFLIVGNGCTRLGQGPAGSGQAIITPTVLRHREQIQSDGMAVACVENVVPLHRPVGLALQFCGAVNITGLNNLWRHLFM
jgi:hypothetical protein